MDLWMFEWKKILLYQKGAGLILLFIILKILGLFLFEQPVNADIAENKESYEMWLDKVEGKLDDDKKVFIEEMSSKYTLAESRIQKIYMDYSHGKINLNELESELSELDELMQKKKGFNLLFEQYRAIREQPENRYFINPNAWNGILVKENINYLLMIFVAIVGIQIIGIEQKNGMDILIKISGNGGRKLSKNKIINYIILIISMVLLDFLIEYVFFDIKYSFSHGEYPLQSLDFFKEYSGCISIRKAMFLLLLIRILGYIYLGIYSCTMFAVTKKYAMSLLIVFSSILLPYYGIESEYLKYYLPLPLGLMISSGYFKGSQYIINDFNSGKELIFREMEIIEILMLIGVVFVLVIGMIIYLFNTYTNYWDKSGHKLFRRRKAIYMLILVVCSGVFTGCMEAEENKSEPQNDIFNIYNTNNCYNDENEKYIFYLGYDESEAAVIYYMDKESGEKDRLIKDAFRDSKQISPVFYVNKNNVYYMEWTYDEEERGLARKNNTFSIVCIDTDTFQSKTIFSDNANISPQYALGAGRYYDKEASFYLQINSFIVLDDRICFITSDEIWEMNLFSGDKRKLLDYWGNCYSYREGMIYYLDNMSRLIQYNLYTKETIVYDDVAADTFCLRGEEIIYKNRKDNLYLYTFSLNTKKNIRIWAESVFSFTTDGKSIFFTDMDFNLYRLDEICGNNKLLKQNIHQMTYCFKSYDKIFMLNGNGETECIEK